MKKIAFNEEIEFDLNRVNTKLIVETSFSKEIRILMKKGQIMKEHKTPFPIVIHLLKGNITMRIKDEDVFLQNGDIISLDGNIPHDLTAIDDAIIRLTLSKLDKVERLDSVIGE